ncbi:DNA primase family protein [Actinomadura rifamycini]|uniref:DNA primase family protein n=1 Tax=Actinomadura rifamycini TaxID=31962 RepID=UPI00047EB6AE|nr:phage/plasmid primase, P4 family [Actinomadura rifamycini]
MILQDEKLYSVASLTLADMSTREAIRSRLIGDQDSDVDRAVFMANELDGVVIHIPGPGWFVWTGTVWAGTSSDAPVRALVQRVTGEILATAANFADDDTNLTNTLVDIARKFRQSYVIDRVLKEIQAMPQIAREVHELDGDPELLTFRNGTVDLRTGNFTEPRFDPANMLTRLVDIDYDPYATSDRWESYLESSQPDAEVREFLQRAAGYGITGYTSEECLLFFYGSGRNGKGVFTETLAHAFAPITVTPLADFWYRGPRKGSTIAMLHGARLVISDEMSDRSLDEQFLKMVAAASPLQADPKHKAAYDFKPQGLIIMSGNDKPRITGTDEGIWRRFRCVNWAQSFVGREDRTLKSDLLSDAELTGIAAWVVEGAVRWFEDGLTEPKAVTDATDEYRNESDPFADWIDGYLEPCPDGGFILTANLADSAYAHGVPKSKSKTAITQAVLRQIPGAEAARARQDGRLGRGVRGVRMVKTASDERFPGIQARI